jgi:hypothetical protein
VSPAASAVLHKVVFMEYHPVKSKYFEDFEVINSDYVGFQSYADHLCADCLFVLL